MSWKNGNGEWELPKFKDAHQFLNLPGVKHAINTSSVKVEEFWSVKFYPYNKPGVDPIYAVVGGKHIVICRPPTEENGVEVIRLIMDEEPSADHYTCCWTKDLATKTPLLCVAGVDAKIKIFDVLSGKLVRVLIGHGGEIDELTISPINPHILASCSTDSTIRIWSLDPTHKDFPCAAILTGGHKDTVTTIDFHHSGRYLISGGVDHMICLWTLPKFPDKNTGTKLATQIQYPHFASSDIHTDAVDCVRFYDDSILSRGANENCIVLWEITGFDSEGPIPDHDKAPTQHEAANASSTLTCFTDPSRFDSYVRIIEFSAPETETFWIRFSLFQGLPIPPSPQQTYTSPYPPLNANPNSNPNPHPSTHAILAIGSHNSKIYFWDLTRLTFYHDYTHPARSTPTPTQPPPRRPPFLNPHRSRLLPPKQNPHNPTTRLRDISPASSSCTSTSTSTSTLNHAGPNIPLNSSSSSSSSSSSTTTTTTAAAAAAPTDLKIWNAKYNIAQKYPLRALKAHREEVIRGWRFVGRGVEWSGGGEWCVVVGGERVVGVLGRW